MLDNIRKFDFHLEVNKMSAKEIDEYARKDFKTNDKEYNTGLKLIKEYGYSLMAGIKEVEYYCMCNNVR